MTSEKKQEDKPLSGVAGLAIELQPSNEALQKIEELTNQVNELKEKIIPSTTRETTVSIHDPVIGNIEVYRPLKSGPIISTTMNGTTDSQGILEKLMKNAAIINIAKSFGINEDLLKLYRPMPIRIYLNKFEGHSAIEEAFRSILKQFGFDTFLEKDAEIGSWKQKLLAFTQDRKTKKEFMDDLKKLKHALELQNIQRIQAEVSKSAAESVKEIAEATKKQDFASIQAGSIIFLKYLDENGKSCVITKTLTTHQMMLIENDPSLIENPETILNMIQNNKLPLQATANARQASS